MAHQSTLLDGSLWQVLLDSLKQEFSNKHSLTSFGRGTARPCAAIHVRHGDKIIEKKLGISTSYGFNHSALQYVEKAILLGHTAGVNLSTFFVMTDDKDALQNLNDANTGMVFLSVDTARVRTSKLPNSYDGLSAHGAYDEHRAGYEVLGRKDEVHMSHSINTQLHGSTQLRLQPCMHNTPQVCCV